MLQFSKLRTIPIYVSEVLFLSSSLVTTNGNDLSKKICPLSAQPPRKYIRIFFYTYAYL